MIPCVPVITGPLCTPANESVADGEIGNTWRPTTIQRRVTSCLRVGCLLLPRRAYSAVCGGDLENDTEGRTKSSASFIFPLSFMPVADAPHLLSWCGLSPVTPPTMTSKGIRYQTRWERSIKYKIFYIITFFFLTQHSPVHSIPSTLLFTSPHTYPWAPLVRKTNYPVGCSFSFAFYTVINSRTSEREGYRNVKLFIGVSNQRSCRGVGGG